MNALRECHGPAQYVFHAPTENNLTIIQKLANVLLDHVGTVMAAQRGRDVQMENNGMFLHSNANVQSGPTGTEHTALSPLLAEEVNIITKNLNVSARLALISGMDIARQRIAGEDSTGMAQNVCVSQDTTLMELFACCVSMDKNGIIDQGVVVVVRTLSGMEISVRRGSLVQEEGNTIKIMISACVLMLVSGTEPSA